MNKKRFYLIFYIIALLFIVVYIIGELMPSFDMSEFGRLFLLCGSCLFMYFGGLFLSKYKKDNKPMKINLWIYFVLYIILLLTLTLFDPMWGRYGISFSKLSFENIIESSNLIPFKTINMYISQFDSMYSTRQVILNLFGNVFAFMPMSFFLPLLFEKENKFINYFFTIFLIVLGIELTQILTSAGRFDIDDIILNVLGAIVMYFILRVKTINKLIQNIFLLEKNIIVKKDLIRIIIIIIIIIIVLVIVIGIFGIIKFRDRLYRQNYDDYDKLHNPIIKIIDESNSCDEDIEPFYENDFNRYYFSCSNNVYAILNDEEKYLVTDILDGKTKYDIDLYRMLDRLNFYEIGYTIESKNEYISFNIKVLKNSYGDYYSPDAYVSVEDDSILSAKFDYFNAEINDENYVIDLHLIAKKSGRTNIYVTFVNNNKLIESYRYSVIIDEKLNIKY